MRHLLIPAVLFGLCFAWGLFQRWLALRDPELPGLDRPCGSCGACPKPRCEREKGAQEG